MSNAFVYSEFLLRIVAIFSPLAKLKVEGWDAIAIDVFIASFPFHLKGDLKEKAWPHLVRLPKTFASWQLRNLTWPHLAVGFRPPIAIGRNRLHLHLREASRDNLKTLQDFETDLMSRFAFLVHEESHGLDIYL